MFSVEEGKNLVPNEGIQGNEERLFRKVKEQNHFYRHRHLPRLTSNATERKREPKAQATTGTTEMKKNSQSAGSVFLVD
jgi:hypothetical protein